MHTLHLQAPNACAWQLNLNGRGQRGVGLLQVCQTAHQGAHLNSSQPPSGAQSLNITKGWGTGSGTAAEAEKHQRDPRQWTAEPCRGVVLHLAGPSWGGEAKELVHKLVLTRNRHLGKMGINPRGYVALRSKIKQ